MTTETTATPIPPRTRDDLLAEFAEAHRALDDLGVPREVAGVTLNIGARIGLVRRSAIEAAKEEVRAVLASYLERRAAR